MPEAPNVLCVAGAGSGKTMVLTKRIEFLVKHKGVDPSKILANSFMNDCFSVMNYFKVTGGEYDFSKDVDIRDRKNAGRIFGN